MKRFSKQFFKAEISAKVDVVYYLPLSWNGWIKWYLSNFVAKLSRIDKKELVITVSTIGIVFFHKVFFYFQIGFSVTSFS